MSEHKTFTNDTIRPHGGTLVNRIVEGTESCLLYTSDAADE